MFKIALTPTYIVPIKVVTPNEKGTNDTSYFKAEFERFNLTELEDLKTEKQADVLRKALVGYSDLIDGDGNQLEFNEVNLEILLRIPQALKALSEAFWETQFSAREKN